MDIHPLKCVSELANDRNPSFALRCKLKVESAQFAQSSYELVSQAY